MAKDATDEDSGYGSHQAHRKRGNLNGTDQNLVDRIILPKYEIVKF